MATKKPPEMATVNVPVERERMVKLVALAKENGFGDVRPYITDLINTHLYENGIQ